MSIRFEKVEYVNLNARGQEMYNFQKVSAVLADYGFTTMWLNNDWHGADFIAIHADGETDIKVQLKGRLTFARKYIGKEIYICFIDGGDTYLYPHDSILQLVEDRISDRTWLSKGTWSTPSLTAYFRTLLSGYKL
jgi:hypothetical protein